MAQERVFLTSSSGSTRNYNIEINPKLDSLNELLNDIEEDDRNRSKEKRSRLEESGEEPQVKESKDVIDIIIVVENRYSVHQIETFRDKGLSCQGLALLANFEDF